MKFLLALLVVVVFLGCKPAPKTVTVSGQVFITLKNRETIKLSLVPVLLVESNSALDILHSVSSDFSNNIEGLVKQHDAVGALAESLRPRIAELSSQVVRFQRDAKDIEDRQLDIRINGRKFKGQQIESARAEFARLENESKTNRFNIDAANSELSKLRSELKRHEFSADELHRQILTPRIFDSVMDIDWPSVSKTTTDADGFFTISARSSKNLVLIAYAKRSLPNDTEDLFWLQPSKSGKCLLHNGNLFNLTRR
jgi:hypothetical protein